MGVLIFLVAMSLMPVAVLVYLLAETAAEWKDSSESRRINAARSSGNLSVFETKDNHGESVMVEYVADGPDAEAKASAKADEIIRARERIRQSVEEDKRQRHRLHGHRFNGELCIRCGVRRGDYLGRVAANVKSRLQCPHDPEQVYRADEI